MKSLIFVLCLGVAITTIAGSWIDDAAEGIANAYNVPTADVKACFVEKNIHLVDGLVTALILTNQNTSDVQDSALKVGCLFSCIFKKKGWMDGTTLKIDVLKEEMSPNRTNTESSDVLDTCSDQVKDLTNECEVMLNYLKCYLHNRLVPRI